MRASETSPNLVTSHSFVRLAVSLKQLPEELVRFRILRLDGQIVRNMSAIEVCEREKHQLVREEPDIRQSRKSTETSLPFSQVILLSLKVQLSKQKSFDWPLQKHRSQNQGQDTTPLQTPMTSVTTSC